MNISEWVQISVAAVLTLTLVAILWYAWQTKRQADASVKMMREMREQRLAPDRPYLLIEVPRLHAVEWEDLKDGKGAESDSSAAYPKSIAYRVHNAGRGPAKELVTTLLQPLIAYNYPKKDVLMPGESWHIEVKASKALGLIRQGFTGEKPLGIEDWMKSQGVDSPFYGDRFNCGLMVGCTDIHDRHWATYLKFGLIFRTEGVKNEIVSRTMVPVEHRIVQLEEPG